MTTCLPSELESFHHFLSQQLTRGCSSLSPEEALDLWRTDHPADEADAETVAASREALEDMESGDRGRSLDEFDREFRKRHPLVTGA
jgi:hypothetical protein